MENLQPGRRPADTMGFHGDEAKFEFLLQTVSRIRLRCEIDLDGCPPHIAAIIRETHSMATSALEYVHQSTRMQHYQPSGHNEGPPPGARYNEIRSQRIVPPGQQGGRCPRSTRPTPNIGFSQARSSHASLVHGGPSDGRLSNTSPADSTAYRTPTPSHVYISPTASIYTGSVPHVQYDVNDEAYDVDDEAGDDVEEDLPEGVWHNDVPVPGRTIIRPPSLGKL